MKKCIIRAVPVAPGRFDWSWQARHGAGGSERAFRYFYDCLEDARKQGFQVDIAHVVRELRALRRSA